MTPWPAPPVRPASAAGSAAPARWSVSPGAMESPNLWRNPDGYERQNRALDPDGLIDAALWRVRPWTDAVVADVGCGSGFHLPAFAAQARAVVGVEPHEGLVARARARTAGLANVRVAQGSAQSLPLPDRSADVVHARWAYFFGPGCEPGLREARRVARRGGAIVVVDVDATRGDYGRWFRRSLPVYDAGAVERFWAREGFSRERVRTRWAFPDRAGLAELLRMEFTPEVADAALSDLSGAVAGGSGPVDLPYDVNVWWLRA